MLINEVYKEQKESGKYKRVKKSTPIQLMDDEREAKEMYRDKVIERMKRIKQNR